MKRIFSSNPEKSCIILGMQIILILFFALGIVVGTISNVIAQDNPEAAANADLDVIAKDIAVLCAQPGFRGFLRSEISKSKNRENIIELDKFLDRASKQKNMPPGLAKAKNDAIRSMNANLKPFSSGGRLDLYIPVEAHRTKWKGGEDFLVASSPVDDESNIKQIVAYRVRDGQRVILDPNNAPDTPVLIVAACEHGTHDVPTDQPKVGPVDRQLPVIQFNGQDAPDKSVKQDEGNSWVGIYRIYVRDDKEPWTRGKPEFKLFFGQRLVNICDIHENGSAHHTSQYMCQSGGGDIVSFVGYDYLMGVDKEKTWYYVWYPGSTSYCDGRNGYYDQPCYNYNSSHGNRVLIRIYEEDGPYCNRVDRDYCESGVYCNFRRDAGDDYVDHGSVYLTNFNYWTIYRQDLGNAIVEWVKVP